LRTRATRLLAAAAGLGAAVLLTAGGAAAHPLQHGPSDGHLPGSGAWGNIKFVSNEIVTDTPELVADVTVNPAGTYAFLANWGEDCTISEGGGINIPDAGAWVIDIRDLKNPRQVGFIPSHQDSRPGEGMQAVNITTPRFSGDILVMNNEQYCTNLVHSQGKGGVSLWDVSNPLKPVKLSENWGDRSGLGNDSNDIHSAFAWDAGSRAYVVIVDNIEFPDVDILDITNPKRPRLVAEYDLNEFDVDQPDLQLTNSFIHDMIVKKIGNRFVMLVSYWDGGYVQLDVTDPANAVYLGDTDYAAEDPEMPGSGLTPEGNGHQAEFTIDNQYFIATDEDFDPYRTTDFRITSGPHAGNEYQTAPTGGGASVVLLDDHRLNGPVVYGGYGCPLSEPIPPADSIDWAALGLNEAAGEEKIVVLQRGPSGDPSAPEGACFPGEKAEMGHEAGYDAVILVARHLHPTELDGTGTNENLPPFCGTGAFPAHEPIVTVCTTHTAFHNMFGTEPNYAFPYPPEPNTEPNLGQTSATRVEVDSIFDGWGYVHLFSNTEDGDATQPGIQYKELDTFAVPEAHDPDYAFGFGDLSVHEVAVDPDNANRAYLSYYDAGLRALRIVGEELVETGGYIDPDTDGAGPDEGGNDFWGVETFQRNGKTVILGSDRDSGLWIFKQIP
jgi:hypothetical protein